jgi:hypothetical protein
MAFAAWQEGRAADMLRENWEEIGGEEVRYL